MKGEKNMKPENTIKVVSEKYGVTGQIQDYSFVIKLHFSYEGREHVIGIHRPFQQELSDVGLRIMETTIERLLSKPKGTFLHYWYVCEERGGLIAHGIVTGHKKLPDSTKIHTSPVLSIEIDAEQEEAILTTKNTVYRCPLRYCYFRNQDKCPEILPDYKVLKEQYQEKIELPEIEPGKVLLVLSDFDNYYFHSLCVKDEAGNLMEYFTYPHIGIFQDSFLIYNDYENIDLRYFPHFRNIEFYETETNGMPLYAENIGMNTLYIRLGGMQFSLKPGERKELTEENAEEIVHDLPDGDLYPAGT